MFLRTFVAGLVLAVLGGCVSKQVMLGAQVRVDNAHGEYVAGVQRFDQSGFSYQDLDHEYIGVDVYPLTTICVALFETRDYGRFEACAATLEAALRRDSRKDDPSCTASTLAVGPKCSEQQFRRKLEAKLDYYRAAILLDLGNLAEAERKLLAAEQAGMGQWASHQGPSFALRLYAALGIIAGQRGELARVDEYLRKIEASKSGFWNTGNFNKQYNLALAKVAVARGDYAAAKRYLDSWDGSSGVFAVAEVLSFTSWLEKAGGELTGATLYAKIPLAYMKAKVEYELGNLKEAKALLSGFVHHDNFADFQSLQFSSYYDLGRIARDEGDQALAFQYFASAIEVIEGQRARIRSEASKIGFSGNKQEVYRDMVALLVGQGRAAEAFEYAERAKSRALIDTLASHQQFGAAASNGGTQTMLARLASSEEQALSPQIDSDTRVRSAAVEQARAQRQAIVQQAPQLASLVTVSVTPVKDIQSRLPAKEALLEYYGDDSHLYAFVLTRKGISVKTLDANGLAASVKAFREALMDPQSSRYRTEGQRLYRRLVSPIADTIKGRNLTIVPHGVLHYLPFAALTDGKRFLVDRHATRMLPSASVLQFLGKPGKAGGRTLLLGNPDLKDPQMDLPGAEAEVVAIHRRLKGSKLLLRGQASETTVKTDGKGYSRLHFASHGVFDAERPLASGLLLARDGQNDGALTVGELYGLELNADLVTLSACETALGKVHSGDDVVGFTRGFLYAGARSIVSSLWQVEDESTSRLMQAFYVELNKRDKRDALRRAQLKLKRGGYEHPFFWAAFQLTGAAG